VQLDHEFSVPVPAEQAWAVLLDIERIAPCLPGATVTKVEGRDFEGSVKVKVGPITLTYAGEASFTEIDEAGRRAVISARGKEARGSGTANATITAQLTGDGGSTAVTVRTDLAITGRPAQFGRGVMNDVGAKLLGRFADRLAQQLAETSQQAPGSGQAAERERAPEREQAAGPEQAPQPAAQPAVAGAGMADGSAAASRATGAATAAHPPAVPLTGHPAVPSASQSGVPSTSQPRRPEADDAIDLLEAAGLPVLKRLVPAMAGLALLGLATAAVRRRRG
jgi:carbon monoxide dehydrogenase subunit G